MERLQRYFIELAYNGTVYHGWQIQKNAISVQEILNKAMSTVLRAQIETLGCGRTDAGVHATQLYAHFDSNHVELDKAGSKFLTSVNALLPYDISVKRVIGVAETAHARFDATERSYEYHIHFYKDPFKYTFSWLMLDKPDVFLMNQAAKILFEYEDFSCFSKSNTQTFTNNCKIFKAEWKLENNKLVFYISADRFLRNMVRAIVGTLLMVGKRQITLDDVRLIIESKRRSNAGTSVPACGLYLTEVKYPYIS